jgi:hypothetical protein
VELQTLILYEDIILDALAEMNLSQISKMKMIYQIVA